jgi:hypothetical protein
MPIQGEAYADSGRGVCRFGERRMPIQGEAYADSGKCPMPFFKIIIKSILHNEICLIPLKLPNFVA